MEKRKIGFLGISFLKLLGYFRAIFLCARRVEARDNRGAKNRGIFARIS